MARKDDKYRYLVIWSEEDSEYVALCAEFPSVSWLAHTPAAALKGIRNIIGGVVTDMQANHEPIPESPCLN